MPSPVNKTCLPQSVSKEGKKNHTRDERRAKTARPTLNTIPTPEISEYTAPKENLHTTVIPKDFKPAPRDTLEHLEAPPLVEQVLRHEANKLTKKQRKVDDALTVENWYSVLDAYRQSGFPAVVAKTAELSLENTQHLLDRGIVRLGYPSIASYAISQVEQNLAIHKVQKERSELARTTEAVEAIQKRVADEVTAAQRLLDIGSSLNTVMEQYLNQTLEAIAEGRMAKPEEITRHDIEGLTKALDLHSKIIERAIKLKRLTAGQPTDLLGVKVGIMVEQLNPSDLARFAETGELPPALRAKRSTSDDDDDSDTQDTPNDKGLKDAMRRGGIPIIDAEYEEVVNISTAGKIEE